MFNKWRETRSARPRTESDIDPDSNSHPQPHSHSHELPSGVATGRGVKFVTFSVLAAVAIATGLGLVALWPDSARVSEVAEQSGSALQGVSYEQGEVLAITQGCEEGGGSPANSDADVVAARCLTMSIGVRSGPDLGRMIETPVRGGLAAAGLQIGDRVELIATQFVGQPGPDPAQPGPDPAQPSPDPAQTDQDPAQPGSDPAQSGPNATAPSASPAPPGGDASPDQPTTLKNSYELKSANYGVSGVLRGLPLLLLALVFAAVVVWVGRLRGFLALVALIVSAGVLMVFVLPALISGQPGVPVALVGASTIMFVILYAVHGLNMRTTAALVGTLCGIVLMAGISMIAVHTTRLSGIGDEAAGFLSAVTGHIDFRGLLTCAIIIAGLGILNDVTITQASAVWELRAAAPGMSRREIYARAMRIGRDHIASTVYTVFFAYVGAALSALLIIFLSDRPLLSLLTKEDIVVEIVRTFCGSIGLVLAVPITTWVAALFTPPGEEERVELWRDRVSRDQKPHTSNY